MNDIKNIKLIISYDGTDFHGWQVQPGMRTVAGEVTSALEKILREPVSLTAASRTDAGVHAFGQTANFKTENDIQLSKLIKGVNSILPDDVSILSMKQVKDNFHSAFDAKGKHYRYRLFLRNADDPMSRRFHWHFPYSLDLGEMAKASKFMTGKEVEFKGLYVNSDKPNVDTVRNISKINLNFNDTDLIIDIFGENFMYKMVRSMVGLLVAVGNGKIRLKEAPDLLSGNPENRKTNVAPPHGLTLMEVYY